ncbi:hypothetical protein SP7_0044 [Escherichia phage vB_EcoP_SP7]|uniref:Uncharacterized protein n=1 Tax=Escherichia phage vB_EcoP_SP7 TaxID=2750854 RepID=A0A7D5FI59_9CAUD|nr:hypothetical protein SP7_0044 [Escherichia phage vB_EcoP_SP7]
MRTEVETELVVVEVEANYTLTNVCNNFGSRTTRFKLEVL